MPGLSRRMSRSLSGKIPLADNSCFQNSYWALRHIAGRALLVIGHAEIWGFTVRHAWIEIGKSIIDPSWIGILEKSDRPKYWAMHCYTKTQVKKLWIMRIGRVVREPLFNEWGQIRDVDEAADERVA
jgi:hypothetical protein